MRPVAILRCSIEWIAAQSKGQVDVRQVRPSSLIARLPKYLVTGCRAQLTIAENWDSCLYIVGLIRQSQHLSLVKGVAKREMPQV